MNTSENKPSEAKEEPKTKIVGVPTQRTFVFKGSSSQEKIDSTINPWLKLMALKGQSPFLGKVTTQKRFFTSRIIYVFMFTGPAEIPNIKSSDLKKTS